MRGERSAWPPACAKPDMTRLLCPLVGTHARAISTHNHTTDMPRSVRVLVLAALCAASASAQQPARPRGKAQKPEPQAAAPATPVLSRAQLKALRARSIGPAVMGGRVADLALDPQDGATFYVALGTGGVMKTSDNGATFQPIFEHEKVVAVGAVAVSPANPKLVWVGTGEANDRNSSQWGDGVYKSTDGGATWTNVGLRTSRTIARIVPHPTDTNIAFVAAMGDLWNFGGERGLYRTTDGGATWKLVLSAPKPYDDRVGAGDVVIDPKDPNTVYAALYARQRRPWAFLAGPGFTDGKDLGGIFKSTDGGTTWKKLTNGLPPLTRRIGLAISASNPKVVMAVVQSDEGGLQSLYDIQSKAGGVFRSEDGGETWKRMNPLNPRPFYFSQIRIDPTNDRTVYVLGFALHMSTDGGATFNDDRFKNVHADNHALVIDPANPKRLILGTDGGVYQSYNNGTSWAFLNRFSGGEYYRINADSSTPYRVCGGLQDNLTWVGPSATRSREGIRNADWINVYGGDGFYCFFDDENPDIVFAESQEGFVHRLNLRTGEFKLLRPNPAEGSAGYRFHWNSPLIPSRHTRRAFYLAGNRVFKHTERGDKWTVISPDLSTRDPEKTTTTGSGAENYGVVYSLAESPLKAGMLWAATDDGKVWRTVDDGATWTDLTANLPAAAKGLWMSRIEASWHDPEVAYLAVSGFRSGVFAPLAYRTEDGGRTWQSVVGDLPADGPVKVVREDPKNPDLLYAGTEFGLFVSTDRGAHWVPLGELPTVAVDDIMIHPRELDLIIATHGRSLYIIDDLRPLQQWNPAVHAKAVEFFEPRPAIGFYPLQGWTDSGGSAEFKGENPPDGAIFNYWVKEYTGDQVSFRVEDGAGRVVANLTGPGTPGFNRVTWDLKPTADLRTPYGGQEARLVKGGNYKVTMTYGKTKVERTLKVVVDDSVETW